MALLEKHRSVIYAHLVEHVGEEAAEAMLAQFPSRDLDEPVTKEFVALQIAELRTEMHQEFSLLRADMLERFDAMDDRIGQKLTAQDDKIGQKLTAVDDKIDQKLTAQDDKIDQKLTAQDDKIDSLHAEMASMRVEMHQLTERVMNRVQLMAGLIVVALAVVGVLTR